MADEEASKLGKETIYIDVEDEITSIIDKVESAKGKVVALVLPKRASSLQSIVNMRLLARAADGAGKNVVLVTSEEALMPLAGAAGLHVAKSLQSKPTLPAGPASEVKQVEAGFPINYADEPADAPLPGKIDYDKSIGELAQKHDEQHPETIEIGAADEVAAAAAGTEKLPGKQKQPHAARVKVPNFDRFRLMLGAGIAGLIALIILIILAFSVLPKATIAIQTTSQPVSANLSLTASGSAKSLDESKGIIPSQSKTSDQTGSQQVAATGQQNNGSKATGTVTLSQDPCSSPPTVNGGTGVASGGLTFTTNNSVKLSSLSTDSHNNIVCSGDVGVTAQQGGSKYNLPAGSSFSVNGSSSITGSNSSALHGGTDNIQTVLSQADVDAAKQKITGASASSFTSSFESQLSQQGFYVLTPTLSAGDPQVTASPDVGQVASTSNVTVKVTYSVLVIKKADLVKAITDATASQIDKTKQKLDAGDVIKNAQITVGNQTSPTDATLSISENTTATPILDINSIKKQALGQKSGDIQASITNIPGVKSVTVKLSPFWVSKAPGKTGKIKVTVQHVTQ